jgi:hypothetical protein
MHWRRETETERERTEQGESVTDEVAKRLITIIK